MTFRIRGLWKFAFGIFLFVPGASTAKEDVAPYLERARSLYMEGDYDATRDLCEAILKTEPAHASTTALLERTRFQLGRLAREAYEYGILLESMNRIEEAKRYWQRAWRSVRPGDRYHEWIANRLAHYGDPAVGAAEGLKGLTDASHNP